MCVSGTRTTSGTKAEQIPEPVRSALQHAGLYRKPQTVAPLTEEDVLSQISDQPPPERLLRLIAGLVRGWLSTFSSSIIGSEKVP